MSNNHGYFDGNGNKMFPYIQAVKDAAHKLQTQYFHELLPNEQQDLNDMMGDGEALGELKWDQASRLGKMTYTYPNKRQYIPHGWWTGADKP